IFIFFITTAVSSTFDFSEMTIRGSLYRSLRVKVIWCVLIAGTASILLISGNGGLDALQTASLIAALPFSIVMLFLILSMVIIFSRDRKVERRTKQRAEKSAELDTFKDEVREDFYDNVKEDFVEKNNEEFMMK